MKRLNPILLRLFYNKNNKYQLRTLNSIQGLKFYYYITQLLIFTIKRIFLRKRLLLFFDYWALLTKYGVYFFFQYFFISHKIFRKKFLFFFKPYRNKLLKKSWVLHKLFRLIFVKISVLFFYFYNFNIFLLPQNLFFLSYNIKNLQHLTSKRIFSQYAKFSRLILLTNLALFFRNTSVLTYTFCQAIRKNKKHHQSLNWFISILKFLMKYQPRLSGLLIRVSGRFNNKMQASHRLIYLGKTIKLNTLDTELNYSYRTIVTPIGIFGIKIWLI